MKNDVYVCQHDTLRITADLYKADGTTYTMVDGDVLWLTAKKDLSSSALLDTTSTTPNFSIASVSLDVGTYLLEIGITYASGVVETISQSHLVVCDRLKGVTTS